MKQLGFYSFILLSSFLLSACATSIVAEPKATHLRQCVVNADISCINQALSEGADINSKQNGHGSPVLVTATANGKMDIVKLLISKGANVNNASDNKDYIGTTPLVSAVRENNLELVELLVKSGADINYSLAWPMRVAISNRRVDIVEFLLRSGADTTIKLGNGMSLLYVALSGISRDTLFDNRYHSSINKIADKKIIDMLVKKGLSFPQSGQYSGLKMLKKMLCDYHHTDWNEVALAIIRGGIDVNDAEKCDDNPVKTSLLQDAISNGQFAIVNELIEKGADINASHGFKSPFIQAVGYDARRNVGEYDEIAALLVAKGATLLDDNDDKNGKTTENLVKEVRSKGLSKTALAINKKYGSTVQAKIDLTGGPVREKPGVVISRATVPVPTAQSKQRDNSVSTFIQEGHSGNILAMAVSPDGKTVLSGDHKGVVNIWDIATGRELLSFHGHKNSVMSAVFSPDGRYAVTGGEDRSVAQWDVENGNELWRYQGEMNIYAVDYAPDGKNIAIADGRIVKILDAGTGKLVKVFHNGVRAFGVLAYTASGLSLISGEGYSLYENGEGTAKLELWDVATGKKRWQSNNVNVDQFTSISISPDDRYVATACNNSYATITDISNGKQQAIFGDKISSVNFSRNGKYLLTGSQDKKMSIVWDVASKSEVKYFRHESILRNSKFTSRAVLTAAGEGMILWDVDQENVIRRFDGNTSPVHTVALAADGTRMLVGSRESASHWDLTSGMKTDVKIKASSYGALGAAGVLVAYSPDGKKYLSAERVREKTFEITLRDAMTNAPIKTYFDDSNMLSISFSPDSTQFVTTSSTSVYAKNEVEKKPSIKLWDIATGRFQTFKDQFKGSFKVAAFSPDGTRLVTSGLYLPDMRIKNVVEIWDVINRKLLHSITLNGDCSAVAFSPDGRTVIISNDNEVGGKKNKAAITLWDAATWQKTGELPNVQMGASSLAFSPDGKYVLAGLGETTKTDFDLLKLWEVTTRKFIRSFNGHKGKVTSVAFFKEGGKIASGSVDGTVRLWDMKSGNEIAKFADLADGESITLIPEGYYTSSQKGHNYLNIRADRNTYGIDQFYDVFYRPDIIQAKLTGQDIRPLIGITITDALKTPPPTVRLTKVPADTSASKTQVCYQAVSTGGGIGEVRLFHNGKLIKSDGFYRETAAKGNVAKRNLSAMNSRAIRDEMRGLRVKSKEIEFAPVAKPKGNLFEECLDVEPVPGENEIGVTAFNAGNTIQSYMQTTSFTSSRPPEEPHLYILAVGIDSYADSSVNLKYAAKDASDFIAKLPQKAQGLYKPGNIHLEKVLDGEASRSGILGKLNELAGKIKSNDSFILFVASHGLLLQNQYHIVTADYDGNVNDTKKLISSNEIVEMSKKIKSLSQLFIFDTCHAGGVDNIISGLYDARMSVMAKKMGLHIYASAGSVQTAMDGYQGNGLYTHTLLKGIENGPDVDKQKIGKVTVKDLGLYTKEKTTEISTKLGHPQTPLIINFGRDNALFNSK